MPFLERAELSATLLAVSTFHTNTAPDWSLEARVRPCEAVIGAWWRVGCHVTCNDVQNKHKFKDKTNLRGGPLKKMKLFINASILMKLDIYM